MELFKFESPTVDATVLQRGNLIKGYDSVMWVERYNEAGEFEIEAKLSSGLIDFLPTGTFISHADTLEVMIVENCEIKQPIDEDPTIKFSGRSFISYLENRIVGVNQARQSSTVVDYKQVLADSWVQAVRLINDHVNSPFSSNDQLVNVLATHNITGTGTREERIFKQGNVYARLIEILNVDDVGVKTIRRNTFPGTANDTTLFMVYKGVNRANKVSFSWKSGDLDSLQYLFSQKALKTSALVIGRYVWQMVDGPETKYDRRIMVVDADDIDGKLSAPPTGTALTTILTAMQTRGKQALKSQVRVSISASEISDNTNNRFRRDYNIGDLVTLDGNFGQRAVMRVSEYAEIEDENGESGHPTLSIPGAD